MCICKEPKERGEKARLQRKLTEEPYLDQKTDEMEKRNGARSCWMLNRAGVSSAFFSSLNTLDAVISALHQNRRIVIPNNVGNKLVERGNYFQ